MKNFIFLIIGFTLATWVWNCESGKIVGCALLSISPIILAVSAFNLWAKV